MVESTKNLGGAPEGNQNAAKGKAFHDALRRALARKDGTVDKGLNKVADQLVRAANAGEQWAIKEIADRLDGKPHQSISGEGSFFSVNINGKDTETL